MKTEAFELRDIKSWGRLINRWLADLLPPGERPEVGSEVEAKLVRKLTRRFSYLRAYHACSPKSVASYYERGLVPLDAQAVAALAKELFLSGDFPELDEAQLNEAITRVGTATRVGRVYFDLDEELLIEHCGHYLLYGSEYVLAIAAQLERSQKRKYRQLLKGMGKPTIFVCDVPWKLISAQTKRELVQRVTREAIDLVGRPSYRVSTQDFGFSIRKTLPPQQIVRHYHPQNISDPYQRV